MNDKRSGEDQDRQNSNSNSAEETREAKNPFREPVSENNGDQQDDADLEQQRKEALTERD
jgi:hypothetical protein